MLPARPAFLLLVLPIFTGAVYFADATGYDKQHGNMARESRFPTTEVPYMRNGRSLLQQTVANVSKCVWEENKCYLNLAYLGSAKVPRPGTVFEKLLMTSAYTAYRCSTDPSCTYPGCSRSEGICIQPQAVLRREWDQLYVCRVSLQSQDKLCRDSIGLGACNTTVCQYNSTDRSCWPKGYRSASEVADKLNAANNGSVGMDTVLGHCPGIKTVAEYRAVVAACEQAQGDNVTCLATRFCVLNGQSCEVGANAFESLVLKEGRLVEERSRAQADCRNAATLSDCRAKGQAEVRSDTFEHYKNLRDLDAASGGIFHVSWLTPLMATTTALLLAIIMK